MQTVELTIEMPAEVYARIHEVAKWRNLNWQIILRRVLDATYFIKTQWDADRLIYQDDRVMDFPLPAEHPHGPANSVRIYVSPQIEQSFKKTYEGFGLKDYSIINWGIDCLMILEDALLLNAVYARKPSENKPVIPCPIKL